MQRRRVLGDAELAEPAGRDVQLTHRLAATREERSEEHTSELQSQSNLVCRLLLEKKKETTLRLGPAQRLAGYASGNAGQTTSPSRRSSAKQQLLQYVFYTPPRRPSRSPLPRMPS